MASSSSSDDADVYGKSDWKIDLTSFSKTKVKLETVINDSERCGELMRAYFDKNATAFDRLPFKNKRPELGIFPLCKYFYQPCKESDTGSMSVLNGAKFVKVTESGSKWKIE